MAIADSDYSNEPLGISLSIFSVGLFNIDPALILFMSPPTDTLRLFATEPSIQSRCLARGIFQRNKYVQPLREDLLFVPTF
jgi:hypothetical protein